jgi:CheY-like chemotaxis protein
MVLIVDDNADARELLRRTLVSAGWTVNEAANGRAGLQSIAEEPPQLILLDLLMPDVDGFAFVEELQRHPEWRTIPVIVITAKDLTGEERRRLHGSVQMILQKNPSTREAVLREVQALATARIKSTVS